MEKTPKAMPNLIILDREEVENKLAELQNALNIIETFEGRKDNSKYDFPKGSIKAFHLVLSLSKPAETVKYTEKDIRKAFESARQYRKYDVVGYGSIQIKKKAVFPTTNDYIQSLTQ